MKRIIYTLIGYMLATGIAAAQIITGSVPNTFVNGTIIDATQMNADFTYIVNQVNTNGAKNGVNSDITALSALTTPIGFSAGGSTTFLSTATGGTANAITVSSSIPNISAYTLTMGFRVTFLPTLTNTGATTLNVNGTGVINVVRRTPAGVATLVAGDITAFMYHTVVYDGTNYELVDSTAQVGGYGALTTITAASTTDLGTVPSHLAFVSAGAGPITSFGSSASGTYPIYIVRYNGTYTLTQSASLNLINGTSRIVNGGDTSIWYAAGSGNWYEFAYMPANNRYAPTSASGLTIKNNAVTPNTQIDITASEVVMDATGGANYYVDSYGTCTINFAVNGAGGLDTGAIAANSWYYIYAIGSGTGVSCLASLSSSAPTMPTGYTYKARLGAILTIASNLTRILQKGNTVQYVVTAGASPATPFALGSGVAGACSTPTWVATTAWATYASPTAIKLRVSVSSNTNAVIAVAPNSAYTSTQYFCSIYNGTIGTQCEIVPEASTLQWCSQAASGYLALLGWTDSVNAN